MALPAKTTPNRQKRKSTAEQAEETPDILSHDALKAFIHDNCINDSKFMQLFVAKHIHLLQPESKELYTRQLQALIKTYSDKHGFVGYQDAKWLGGRVGKMAKEALAELCEQPD